MSGNVPFVALVLAMFLAAAFADSARADGEPATFTTHDDSIDMGSFRYRSDDELHADIGAWLGSYSYSMETCSPSSRTVKITSFSNSIKNPFTDFVGGLGMDEAFREAITYAWRTCPLSSHDGGDAYTVDGARVVWWNGEEIARATDFQFAQVDLLGEPHNAYRFGKIVNSIVEAQNAADLAGWQLFFHRVYLALKYGTMAAIAYFASRIVWHMRRWPVAIFEGLLYLYYSLTPHPASEMVHAAVNAGVDLDGAAFAAILRRTPGGKIECAVRAKQAEALQRLAMRSTDQLNRQAEKLRKQFRENAAFYAAQGGLHDAAIEQQLARMRAEALAKIDAFLRRQQA